MRNIICTIISMSIVLFISDKVNAQPILDHVVDSSELSIGLAYGFKIVKISGTESKYFVNDTITNTFNLYNLDFSPFMTNISVPEPFVQGTDRLQALYITRSLFDCDTSNIEFAYYSPADINKSFRIIRTDGTILFQVDSANGPYGYGNMYGGTDLLRPIVNTPEGAKLFLQTTRLGFPQVYIYSLCGTLPDDVFEIENNLENAKVEIFPNPSSQTLTFQFPNLDNINQYELIIFSNDGKEVMREKIREENNFNLDVRSYSPGLYCYKLESDLAVKFSGKFILK